MRLWIPILLGARLAHADPSTTVAVEPRVVAPTINVSPPATIVLTPPAINVSPPATIAISPAGIQGVYAAYRLNVVEGHLLEGGAVRILWGRPDTPFELELMPSGAWGHDGDRPFGQLQLSVGARAVANKHGRLRPYALGSIAFTSFGHDNDDRVNSITGSGGLGVELTTRGPCSVAFDIRTGRGVDFTGVPTDWNTSAMLSVGLYFPDEPPTVVRR